MKTWACRAAGCTYKQWAARWPDEGCGSGHKQSDWILIDPGPPVPRLRMFVDGIGDYGLPLSFMLEWNCWRMREYGYDLETRRVAGARG